MPTGATSVRPEAVFATRRRLTRLRITVAGLAFLLVLFAMLARIGGWSAGIVEAVVVLLCLAMIAMTTTLALVRCPTCGRGFLKWSRRDLWVGHTCRHCGWSLRNETEGRPTSAST